MSSDQHKPGQRVRSVFDNKRVGVVIESNPDENPTGTLIEFEDYDEDEDVPYKHRKWLPTRHWERVP